MITADDLAIARRIFDEFDAGECKSLDHLLGVNVQLIDEILRLRQVLSWYGDKKNHCSDDAYLRMTGVPSYYHSAVCADGGKRAREAIGSA